MHNFSKSILLFIFLLNVSHCFSQQIQVISEHNHVPLPFATLVNLTHPSMASADEAGILNLNAVIGDSLSISFVGYKTTNLIFNGDKIQQVKLVQEKITLPTVIIEKCKKEKTIKYGNTDSVDFIINNQGKKIHFMGGLTSDFVFKNLFTSEQGIKNYLWAVRLNPKKENAHLIKLSFWLDKPLGALTNSINLPLILNFYNVEDSTDLPGHLIYESSIIYYPTQLGKQTLNLDSLHLKIPDNGMYVSFQHVINDKYSWKIKVKWVDSSKDIAKDTFFFGYGNEIEGTYCSKDFNLANYNPILNKWIFTNGQTDEKDEQKKKGTIKYEAVIKYCSE